jgi:hypothetical protein
VATAAANPTQSMITSQCREFAVLDSSYMGLVSSCTEVGDEVHILTGVTMPFAVRCRENGKAVLVGDAYIHRIMDGEAVQDLTCKRS